MPWLSITEYAKKRGVSRQRISKLIHSGRLESATRQKGQRQQIDSDKADKILAANIDPSWSDQAKLDKPKKKKSGGNGFQSSSDDQNVLDFNAAKRIKTLAEAGLKKLELEEKSGKLVNVDEVETGAFNRARSVRDSMMAIPDRIAAILAAETDPVKVSQIMTSEIRQALEALSR